MISVADIINLPSVQGTAVLAGAKALDRARVSEIAIMDAEPLTGAYDSFYPGDVVFTSLGFSGGEGDRIDEALLRLLERDVAGVFLKDAIPYEPASTVVWESERSGIPLVRYGGGMLEQIISEARSLIAEENRAAQVEKKLCALLSERDSHSVRDSFACATGLSGAYVQAVCFAAAEEDPLVVSALRNHVANGLPSGLPCAVCRFEGGVTVFAAADDLEPFAAESVEALIAGFGARAVAGVSDLFSADRADEAFSEAVGCCQAAKQRRQSVVSWPDMGPEAFRAAARASSLLPHARGAAVAKLAASDEETGSNLVESLRVYVECGGDVQVAAKRLNQHPNSLRNRLNRARSVLSLEQATDKQLFAYLAMTFL